MNASHAFNPTPDPDVEVLLDGLPVTVPPDRRSLGAIRSYLDTLALEQQRILCAFSVDGEPSPPQQPLVCSRRFNRVEGETVDLEQLPLLLVRTAMQQADAAKSRAHTAVTLVLINDGRVAREFWWELARILQTPLLTLSLLPEHIWGTPGEYASFTQLRKWQLQQLAAVLREMDESCWSEDTRVLSNALENRLLPWLSGLNDALLLWNETLLAASRVIRPKF